MIIFCCNCGKKCSVKPIKVERGQIDPVKFYCHACNLHLHRTVEHTDTRMQHKIKELAVFKELFF